MFTDRKKASSTLRGCLLLISFLLSSLAFGQLKKAPKWVHKTPATGESYYGVGSVNMKIYPEYRTKARKIALREITEKIFVSINSESTLTTLYKNDEVDYLLDETVSLASTNFLSGHQKVDEWVDKRANRYYVLFRLDIEEYKTQRVKYFQSLEELISRMQNEAVELFNKGEVARGVSKLSESITRLDREMELLVEPEYKLAMQNWQLESVYELEQEIDQIGFEVERRYQFEAISKNPLMIEGFLIDKTRQIPINGLKLSLKVIQGDIFRYTFGHTDKETLTIYGMFPENRSAAFQIVAELRLSNRVRSMLDPSIRTQVLSPPISIDFVPYNITFERDTSDGFSDPELKELIDFFRKITKDLGLNEVESDADYWILIHPKGELRKQNNGSYQGAVSMDLKVKTSNQELFKYALPETQIRVRQSEDALPYALNKYVNQSDKLLVSFVTFLCALQL